MKVSWFSLGVFALPPVLQYTPVTHDSPLYTEYTQSKYIQDVKLFGGLVVCYTGRYSTNGRLAALNI